MSEEPKIAKPHRIWDYHWRDFLRSLEEANIDPDKDETVTLTLWQGYMFGYAKACEDEGCGVTFHYLLQHCVDCGLEMDEEKGEMAVYFGDYQNPPRGPLCHPCCRKREEARKERQRKGL